MKAHTGGTGRRWTCFEATTPVQEAGPLQSILLDGKGDAAETRAEENPGDPEASAGAEQETDACCEREELLVTSREPVKVAVDVMASQCRPPTPISDGAFHACNLELPSLLASHTSHVHTSCKRRVIGGFSSASRPSARDPHPPHLRFQL